MRPPRDPTHVIEGGRLILVVQRYGEEVVGGAERHARLVAERLARRHAVEVATTTALDFWTWAPHYRPGVEEVGGVIVRRFAGGGRRADFKDVESRVVARDHSLADEVDFVQAQGPVVPELLEFLHREGARFDAVLFYGYLYYPTVQGLPLVPERAVLVPTAHDEMPLRLAPYRSLFHLPRAIGFLSPEEADLVRRVFKNDRVPAEILGTALDPPPPHDAAAFRAAHPEVRGALVLYLGQVTEGKGAGELLALWSRYRERAGAREATLVLAGPLRMPVPDRPDVVALGAVSEQEKWSALAAADLVVLPSRFESLGIVLREAAQVATPALVPAANAVTAGLIERSRGGATYASDAEFVTALDDLLGDGRARGEAARAYVAGESTWETFDERLDRLVILGAARG